MKASTSILAINCSTLNENKLKEKNCKNFLKIKIQPYHSCVKNNLKKDLKNPK
jgi:hypothetical protein